MNDDTNNFSDVEQVRGMEGIVRQALLSNPKMAVVLLHFADPGKLAKFKAGETPAVIVNHERVAAHYNVPSINLAREVTERIEAGEFTWESDFKDLHPAPFGHELYANSVSRLFDAAFSGVVTSTPSPLPEPIDNASYFNGSLLNPADVVAADSVMLGDGWKLIDHWKPDDKAGTRPGFVNVPVLATETAGATMTLTFEGRGIGVFVASGPDTGILEYRVDGGDWKSVELFTQWSPSLHLPWAKMLASELAPGSHRLELRSAVSTDARSQGHAIRVVHFLLNGK